MNKKAQEMTKMPIYIIVSLIVGGLLITGFISITNRTLVNTVEEITAKDISLTIMTISAAPYDVVYRYDKNVEEYEIVISEDKVHVESKEGKGTYEYFQMPGVKVAEATLQNVLMVPLTLKGGILSFSDEDADYSDACGELPQTFDDDEIEVRVVIDSADQQTLNKLNEIKDLMEFIASSDPDSPVEFVKSGEDVLIELSTSTDATIKISYYENPEDISYSWYKIIACYSGKGMDEANTELGESALTPISEEKIRIELGKTEDFSKKAQDNQMFTRAIANKLYDAIKLGILN